MQLRSYRQPMSATNNDQTAVTLVKDRISSLELVKEEKSQDLYQEE